MMSQAAINAMAGSYTKTIADLGMRLANADAEVAMLTERYAALQNENTELKKKLEEAGQPPSPE